MQRRPPSRAGLCYVSYDSASRPKTGNGRRLLVETRPDRAVYQATTWNIKLSLSLVLDCQMFILYLIPLRILILLFWSQEPL